MNKGLRKPLMAGNWKMNKTSSEAVTLVEELKKTVGHETEVAVVICPPFTALDRLGKAVEGCTMQLGAQNMHDSAAGAFTGEVSASMLRDLFVRYVILGHSERRTFFGETDAFINKKVLAALGLLIKPILCVGETLMEREAGLTLKIVGRQLVEGLAGISAEQAEQMVVAYEPVWAIGTGRNATPVQAQEVHAFIRGELARLFGKTVAGKIRILYGGSMKPNNAVELLAQPDIDGGLIGGAALEAGSFSSLVEAARKG